MSCQRKSDVIGETRVPLTLCLPKISTWSYLGQNSNLRSYGPATNHVNHGKAKTPDVIQLNKYIYIGNSRSLRGERVSRYTCSVKIRQKKTEILNRDKPNVEQNFSHSHRHIWCTALTVHFIGSAGDCCRPL